jgi:carboxypeptidase C (cathepsin A)
MKLKTRVVTLIILISMPWLAISETTKTGASLPIPKPRTFVKKAQLKTEDGLIRYTTHAGEIYLRNDKGKPTASIFSIAYLRNDITDPAQRPVAFAFNGGPGSSAVWLHYGLLGPMRVAVPSVAGKLGVAPYRIDPNPLSLLRVADLVFIDPVGTGFSRALAPAKNKDFWGVDEDSKSVAEFIRLWISKFNRWNSPKYLIGESYGGTRAVKLLKDLQADSSAINLNGLVLVSPALDYRTFINGIGNLVYYVNHLPAYAAAAWYHNRLPQKPPDYLAFLAEVDAFAKTEYLTALYQGEAIDPKEKERIIKKLHLYTGLSPDYLRRAHLKIDEFRFAKELLRDKGLIIGLHDSRYTGGSLDDLSSGVYWNPNDYITSGFTAAINEYLRRIVGVDWERQYEILNEKSGSSWKRPAESARIFGGWVNVLGQLKAGALLNPDLRIFVVSGYHDLLTTPWGAEWAMAQSQVPAKQVTLRHYEGGHMMYLYEPSFKKLAEDLRDFVSGRKIKPENH